MFKRKNRFNVSGLTLLGFILWVVGLLGAWVVLDFADSIYGLLFVIIVILGGVVTYLGDKKDITKFFSNQEYYHNFPPPNAFLSLGSQAVGLGIIGLVFMYDNANIMIAYIVFEVASVFIGLLLIFIALKIRKTRMAKLNDLINQEKINTDNTPI